MRAAALALALAACGGPQGARSAGEIVIPTDPSSAPARGEEPPPRAEPLPSTEREDPYVYFVGSWQGMVNEKLTTELTVSDDGRFHIHLPEHKHRPACDLFGKLRVAEKVVYFDIDQSNCEAENAGSTLERHVVSKSEDVLVVRAADSKMLVRYTRKRSTD